MLSWGKSLPTAARDSGSLPLGAGMGSMDGVSMTDEREKYYALWHVQYYETMN